MKSNEQILSDYEDRMSCSPGDGDIQKDIEDDIIETAEEMYHDYRFTSLCDDIIEKQHEAIQILLRRLNKWNE